jgi:aminopeptidase N
MPPSKNSCSPCPAETYIAEQLDVVDPQRIHTVREAMRAQLAQALHDDWAWAFESHSENGSYQPDPVSSGRRALSGLALHMLCLHANSSGDASWPKRALQCFDNAHNMTDRLQRLECAGGF